MTFITLNSTLSGLFTAADLTSFDAVITCIRLSWLLCCVLVVTAPYSVERVEWLVYCCRTYAGFSVNHSFSDKATCQLLQASAYSIKAETLSCSSRRLVQLRRRLSCLRSCQSLANLMHMQDKLKYDVVKNMSDDTM